MNWVFLQDSLGDKRQSPVQTGLGKRIALKALFICLFDWLLVLVVSCGIYFPDQGSDQGPLHGDCGVLATGPPGKSLEG